MKKKTYEQYLKESDNWLHRGRRKLLNSCLSPYCQSKVKKNTHRRILEIGAGSGKNIEILSKYGAVDAIEIEPLATKILENNPDVQRLYLNKVPFPLNQKYDIICAMDFLEHVDNDKEVFSWMVDHLKDNGLIFVTVPAYQLLFSYHDIALGHYRRYRLKQLLSLGVDRISLIKKGYFNFFLFPIATLSRILDCMRPGRKKDQVKQSSDVHSYLDFIFFHILQIEINLIRKFSLFPCGLTAFALFRKNNTK